MTDPNLQPIAVWDASRRGWSAWPYWREAEAWASDRGLVSTERGHPRSRTYRIELLLIDGPFARCFRYARDADGRAYTDPLTLGPAVEPPEVIALAELPPDHLLRAVETPCGAEPPTKRPISWNYDRRTQRALEVGGS